MKPKTDLHELDLKKLNELVYAGRAVITLYNEKRGTWYTFKIKASKDKAGRERVYFVDVLRGENNELDYTFIGTIFGDKYKGKVFRIKKDGHFTESATCVKAINYFVENMDNLPTNLKVFHSGTCLRCGRRLTTPESILTGLGPECANRSPQKKGVPKQIF